MIVKNSTHKTLTVAVIVLSMIGILFLLRMVFVTGVSTYMNAESKKEDGKHEVVAAYYMAQAFTGDFMEPYIAFYNAGTSYAKANQPEIAERALEMSLAKVDYDYNECYVRNNLAKVQEQLGDYYMVADMAGTAETYYAKAQTTISESPSLCFPPPPPNGKSNGDGEPKEKSDQDGNPLTPQDDAPEDPQNGENMKETEKRSKDKEGKAKEAQGKTAEGKEKVEQEMDQSKSERDNQEDLSKQQKNNQSKPPVDKPW